MGKVQTASGAAMSAVPGPFIDPLMARTPRIRPISMLPASPRKIVAGGRFSQANPIRPAGECQGHDGNLGPAEEKGHDREGACQDYPQDARQTIDAVEEVDGVHCAQKPEHGDGNHERSQRQIITKERHVIDAQAVDRQANGDHQLARQLVPAAEAETVVCQAQGDDCQAGGKHPQQRTGVGNQVGLPGIGKIEQAKNCRRGSDEDGYSASQRRRPVMQLTMVVGLVGKSEGCAMARTTRVNTKLSIAVPVRIAVNQIVIMRCVVVCRKAVALYFRSPELRKQLISL